MIVISFYFLGKPLASARKECNAKRTSPYPARAREDCGTRFPLITRCNNNKEANNCVGYLLNLVNLPRALIMETKPESREKFGQSTRFLLLPVPCPRPQKSNNVLIPVSNTRVNGRLEIWENGFWLFLFSHTSFKKKGTLYCTFVTRRRKWEHCIGIRMAKSNVKSGCQGYQTGGIGMPS